MVHAVKHRCRVSWACEHCRKVYWLRWQKRLRAALSTELAEAAYTWRMAGRPRRRGPQLVLLTLTIRHSGDVELDRARIAEAWPRWRAWLWRRVGAPPFARVWEFTDGRDGKGHVHLHIATVWPWVDFAPMHAAWSRATRGEGTHIDVSRGKKRGGAKHDGALSSKYVASYLAKYATKGSSSEDVGLLSAWVRASTGRRRVTTSRRLCNPPEPLGCWTCFRPRWKVAWIATHAPPGPETGRQQPATGPPSAGLAEGVAAS